MMNNMSEAMTTMATGFKQAGASLMGYEPKAFRSRAVIDHLMGHEADATEIIDSRELRDRMSGRVDVLDKVKALTLLPDDIHVTVAMAAEFYEVGRNVLDVLIQRNKQELVSDGLWILRGQELRKYKLTHLHDVSELKKVGSLILIPRRALLRIGMLLRDSHIAKQVRNYLLNVEEIAYKEAPEIVDRAQKEVRDIIEKVLSGDRMARLEALIEIEREKKELALFTQMQAEIIEEQKPIVESHKQLTQSEAKFNGSQAARLVGLGRTTFYRLLRKYGFFMQNSCAAYQKYIDEGYCYTIIEPNRNIAGKYEAITLFTAKGLDYVTRLLQRHDHLKPKGNV